jgi:hypothetical protein
MREAWYFCPEYGRRRGWVKQRKLVVDQISKFKSLAFTLESIRFSWSPDFVTVVSFRIRITLLRPKECVTCIVLEVVTPLVMKSNVFWDITPYSSLKVSRRFTGLPPSFALVTCLAYSTLKMKAICSSETSVDFQRTTQRYILEDSTLQRGCIDRPPPHLSPVVSSPASVIPIFLFTPPSIQVTWTSA